MKTLSIDIETYSDVPLQKTGVYRYVESPNFEILLFAYSVDRSFLPWRMKLSSSGPSTLPLNVSASLAS